MKEVFVTRSSMPPIEEYVDEIKDMWDTHWLTNMGNKHRILQKQLCDYLRVSNIELVTNGHMALELTLQAMDLSGEVITTPFTFASTTHAIVRSGLTPVFCDINPNDFTMDVDKLEALITDKTSAILPVHVYGNVCNVDRIEEIANKYGLKVIYDAAHAFGVTHKDRGIGEYGNASCFSFHATKVFNTIEGGAVCYKDSEIGEKICKLKNFGICGPEIVDSIGTNGKMDEFRAAMGICNLRYIEDNIKKRKIVSECYCSNLSSVNGIRLNQVQEETSSNYAYFPILIEKEKFGIDRDEVHHKLEENGIITRKYFYPLTNMFSFYKQKYDNFNTPVAHQISESVLTLPIYDTLSLDIVEKICNLIKTMAL